MAILSLAFRSSLHSTVGILFKSMLFTDQYICLIPTRDFLLMYCHLELLGAKSNEIVTLPCVLIKLICTTLVKSQQLAHRTTPVTVFLMKYFAKPL